MSQYNMIRLGKNEKGGCPIGEKGPSETRGQRLDALEVLHKSDSRILVDRSGWARILKP
jgi:hypothetical protein